MIVDSLQNLTRYSAVHPLFHLVAEFIDSHDLNDLETGTLDIGYKVRAIVDEYDTKRIEEKFIECHRKNIDVHSVVAGIEEIGFCDRRRCDVAAEYDEDKDCEHLRGELDFITLRPGCFAVLFTHEAHVSGLHHRENVSSVKKVVFKIPV